MDKQMDRIAINILVLKREAQLWRIVSDALYETCGQDCEHFVAAHEEYQRKFRLLNSLYVLAYYVDTKTIK